MQQARRVCCFGGNCNLCGHQACRRRRGLRFNRYSCAILTSSICRVEAALNSRAVLRWRYMGSHWQDELPQVLEFLGFPLPDPATCREIADTRMEIFRLLRLSRCNQSQAREGKPCSQLPSSFFQSLVVQPSAMLIGRPVSDDACTVGHPPTAGAFFLCWWSFA